MKMADMKMSKADMKADMAVGASSPNPYPYGLCLNLDKDELKKLGIKDLAKVGDEYHIMAVGKVTSVNQSAREGGNDSASMSIQITMLSLESEAPHAGEAKETAKSETREMGAKSMMNNSYRGKG